MAKRKRNYAKEYLIRIACGLASGKSRSQARGHARAVADASLMKLFRAAEALRQEADPIAAARDKALKELRRLRDEVGGRNKLADLLGVTGPYVGRVLSGEKPMTQELANRLAQIRGQAWTKVAP